MAACARFSRTRIDVIYNAVDMPYRGAADLQRPHHPWFDGAVCRSLVYLWLRIARADRLPM
jgi:hypothetical protein